MPLTPSVAFSSFVSRGTILLALTFSRIALAEEGGLTVDESTEESSPEPSEGPDAIQRSEQIDGDHTAALSRVRIISVGSALSPSSLERTLGPALRASLELSFSSTDRFEPQDLFRSRAGTPASTYVWVDTTAPRGVRIYFANRDRTRYLVRDLESSGSLGEMDREAIAQAIEWSLQALLEGTAGMTREEAERLLSESGAGLESASEPAPEAKPPSQVWRRTADGWLPEVALLHRVTPFSSEYFSTQGPAFRMGVDRMNARSQFGFSTTVIYHYPQRHVEEGIALELQSVGARIDARYLTSALGGASRLGPRLGFGWDTVFASPEILDPDRFEGAERTRNVVPLLEGGVVFQVRAESGVRFETGLEVEVDLVELSYDLETPGAARTLASRWPVRPSLSIGVALF